MNDLRDLYQEMILDHGRTPHDRGRVFAVSGRRRFSFQTRRRRYLDPAPCDPSPQRLGYLPE